jgi:hypothetical protein
MELGGLFVLSLFPEPNSMWLFFLWVKESFQGCQGESVGAINKTVRASLNMWAQHYDCLPHWWWGVLTLVVVTLSRSRCKSVVTHHLCWFIVPKVCADDIEETCEMPIVE